MKKLFFNFLIMSLAFVINVSAMETKQNGTVVKYPVPYICKNDNYSCAETSIAMAISYYENLDKPLDKELVFKISGSNINYIRMYGHNICGLKRIADYYGYKSEFLENMNIVDIEHFLSKGILVMPIITMGNNTSATHAFLIVGYDKEKEIFFINNPSNRQNKIFKYSDFNTKWASSYISSPIKKVHRGAFIIYPKN